MYQAAPAISTGYLYFFEDFAISHFFSFNLICNE